MDETNRKKSEPKYYPPTRYNGGLYGCGACGMELPKGKPEACPKCGNAVQWELESLVPIAEYARRIGKATITVADKCRRGALPGARKIGRDWFVPVDAEYPDYRVKSGKYIDARRKEK